MDLFETEDSESNNDSAWAEGKGVTGAGNWTEASKRAKEVNNRAIKLSISKAAGFLNPITAHHVGYYHHRYKYQRAASASNAQGSIRREWGYILRALKDSPSALARRWLTLYFIFLPISL